MKFFLLFLLHIFTIFLSPVNGQDSFNKNQFIYGLWEDSCTVGSAGTGDTYFFRKDGTFTFTYSQYQWAGRRIISFSGTFELKSDSIFFFINNSREIVGGRIENDGPPNDLGWVVADGEAKSFYYKNVSPIGRNFSIEQDNEKISIKIDFMNFIKISENTEQNE
ncbi:MAG: hypothetical protein LCH54_05995 [Bacteroidetes bacterium]|nr:hypothetical protein [Bacteroidota bacterium]